METMVPVSKQLRSIGLAGRQFLREAERAGELYRDELKRAEAHYLARLAAIVEAAKPTDGEVASVQTAEPV